MSSIEALATRPHDQPFRTRALPVPVARRAGDAAIPQHLALRDPRSGAFGGAVPHRVRRGAGQARRCDRRSRPTVSSSLAVCWRRRSCRSGSSTAPRVLYEARHDKYIHDVFASPLRWWEINAALVTGGMARGIIVGAGFMAIAVPLAHIEGVDRPFVFGFGTLGVLVVAAQIGVIAGSLAKSLDQVYSMESIIVLPLGVLGGVFYSVQQLPPLWGRGDRVQPGLLAGPGRADRTARTR